MTNANCNEHLLVEEVIMPFLRKHWDDIDQPEIGSHFRDGRLTSEELSRAYQKALEDERSVDAWILGEILKRYENICLSYEDCYWWGEETLLGISEEDVSVYEQLAKRKFCKSNEALAPKHWI